MQYNGSAWVAVGSAGFSAGEAEYTTLAFAPDGITLRGVCDGANNGKVTVMALKTGTTTTVINHNPSTEGESVTFTATVTPAAATGMVTFRDGGTTLCSASLSGGTAACSTTSLTVGDHSITAVYSGDATFLGSTSLHVIQQVDPHSYTLTTTISGNGTVTAALAALPAPAHRRVEPAPPGMIPAPRDAHGGREKFCVQRVGRGLCFLRRQVSCQVTVDRAKTCSAAFVGTVAGHHLAGSSLGFSLVQPAYAAAGNGSVIKAQTATFSENLLLDVAGRSVTIKGGYEPTFTTQTGITTSRGTDHR